MLFGNMFKRTRPRGLTWTPRYFDPEDDEALEQERRKSRIQFEQYRSRAGSRRSSGPSMLMLVVFALMVGAIIWVAQRADFSGSAPETRLSPGDAPLSRSTKTSPITVEKEIGTISSNAHSDDTSQAAAADTIAVEETAE